jgi:hypothetical protein
MGWKRALKVTMVAMLLLSEDKNKRPSGENRMQLIRLEYGLNNGKYACLWSFQMRTLPFRYPIAKIWGYLG